MTQEIFSFEELTDKVLEQLRSQNYMDSTLMIYKQTYIRIHVFLSQNGMEFYTHEAGKRFLDSTKACSSTLSAYRCAVRRLDDYIENRPYRCHRSVIDEEIPAIFSDVVDDYLNECKRIGNRQWTIAAKKHSCILFLDYVEKAGCSSLSKLDVKSVLQALLIFNNKDHYARIRMFLRYLSKQNITGTDLSGIVPRYRRAIPIPSTYTPDEITRTEKAVDTNTDTGRRDVAIIRLASRMGLRSGDIAELKLSDIDFKTRSISFVQKKTGIPLTLKMPEPVSEALLIYLDNNTAKFEDGYLFHSMSAPYDQITTGIIRHAVSNAFLAAGINTAGKKHGPHAFRSSLASSMVNDGASYEVTRRILGHADPNVIKRYAKADIKNLRLCSIEPPQPSGLFHDYLSGKKVISYV